MRSNQFSFAALNVGASAFISTLEQYEIEEVFYLIQHARRHGRCPFGYYAENNQNLNETLPKRCLWGKYRKDFHHTPGYGKHTVSVLRSPFYQNSSHENFTLFKLYVLCQ